MTIEGLNENPLEQNSEETQDIRMFLSKGESLEQAVQSYKDFNDHKNRMNHEKKGLEFSIGLVKGLLSFLVFVSLVKLMKQAEGSNITIDLNEYFSLLLPIITTALGYILGKKNN